MNASEIVKVVVQVVQADEARRKIEQTAKSVDKITAEQKKLTRAVTEGERAMSRMWDKAQTATAKATREVQAFNREIEKMDRNSRDIAFGERFNMGKAGKLGNPFTGQGMPPAGAAQQAAQQAGGKIGKTMNTLDAIGNMAAVLSLFDTFTGKIAETANSLKKWDGSLVGSMKLLGDFGGIIFSGIGIVTTLMQAFVTLKAAALLTAAAMPAGAAGAAAGGAAKNFAGGAAGGLLANGGRALLIGAARILWPVAAAAGIAWGANEFLDAQKAAEMNSASKSKDATGKGKGMSQWREDYQKAYKAEEKLRMAEAKNLAMLEAKAMKDLARATKAAEREAAMAAAKKIREEEKVAKAAERAALAMERAAMNALSKSEEFLRALLPKTFAQPLFADPRMSREQRYGFDSAIQRFFGGSHYDSAAEAYGSQMGRNTGEKLGEHIADGIRKGSRPQTMYGATRQNDSVLGAHH